MLKSLRRAFVLVVAIASSLAFAPSSALAANGWSGPTTIDGVVPFTSVSCASPTFCQAVDTNGNALAWNGSSWSSADNIDTSGQPLAGVSCPSSSFCAAVDGAANAYIWNGSWGAPTNISSNGVQAVSCPSSTFCVAVNQWAETYNGSSWINRDSVALNGGETFLAVSCPSSSFCAAVGHNGGAATYDGNAWTSDGKIDNTYLFTLNSVSCASSSFCIAVDQGGNAFQYNGGGSWSGPSSIDPNGQGLASVSCPTTSFCVAVDAAGNALTFNGSSWSQPVNIEPGSHGLVSVSCLVQPSTFCVAVDASGSFLQYPGSTSGGGGGGGGSGGGAGGGQASPPTIVSPPNLTGTAKPGHTLRCSPGSWTGNPTGYTYQWYRNGTLMAGVTGSTYAVGTLDEGTSVKCVVTAVNAGGRASAGSNTIRVPVPFAPHCPAATGRMTGTSIGQIQLGMTRSRARFLYRRHSNRGKQYMDFFCLTPIGVRVGYASPKLLGALPKRLRHAYMNRVVWSSTSNPYYSLDGVRPGESIATASRALGTEAPFHIGLNYWYLARKGGYTAVLKVRGGVVQELGIATNALTATRHAQGVLMHSFY